MKYARAFALTIIGLVLLTLFAWAVKDATDGRRSLGVASKALNKMASFPDDVVAVFNSSQIKGVPDSYMPTAEGFKEVNKLSYDLFGLNSFWNEQIDRWDVRLFNFKDGKVMREWHVDRNGPWMLDRTRRQFQNAPIVHSLALADGSVIAKLEKTPNLMRLDKDSKVLWVNHEMIFHHAIQIDPDSTSFWVCASAIPAFPDQPSIGHVITNLNGHKLPYIDDLIVRVDMATGKILYKKSIAEALTNSNLTGLLYGGGLEDPLHLNDITPVRTPSAYWQPGDLFISLKRRSCILLYRPAKDSVVDVIIGPYLSQHDVNVISDHEISVFNNRYITGFQYPENVEARIPKGTPRDTLNCSRAVVFDFSDRSFHDRAAPLFLQEQIRTNTQGLSEILPNGDLFVESQNQGLYFVLSEKDGVVMRTVFPTPMTGYVHGPNWTRIYSQLP